MILQIKGIGVVGVINKGIGHIKFTIFVGISCFVISLVSLTTLSIYLNQSSIIIINLSSKGIAKSILQPLQLPITYIVLLSIGITSIGSIFYLLKMKDILIKYNIPYINQLW